MEKQLSCNFKLSLEEIALRRVAVVLWSGVDILNSFQKLPFKLFPDNDSKIKWRESIEGKVKDKVSKLELPKPTLEQIMHVVSPIGAEILRWKLFHEKFLGMWRDDLDIRIIEHLIWTSAGSIDYRKSAEEIIRLEMLDTVKHYKLASLYCLEDKIPAIWNELPEKSKKSFYKEEVALQSREPQMEFCWACVLKKEEYMSSYTPEIRFANPTTFCQYAFESSAIKGNKATAEYFFNKLTKEERETYLVRTAKAVLANRDVESDGSRYEFPKEKLSDVLCYLFFQMTPEEQRTVCNEYPFHFLRCFLDWPWQNLFSDMADLVFAFPPENRYEYFVDFISSNVSHSRYYRSELFRKFFPLSPITFRKHCVDRECQNGALFSRILYFTTETVKVIFRCVEPEDRVRLVSCNYFFKLIDRLILTDKWALVELCLQEATLSKEGKDRVRESYMDFFRLTGIGALDIRDEHRKRVLKFLDEMDARYPSNSRSAYGAHIEVKRRN